MRLYPAGGGGEGPPPITSINQLTDLTLNVGRIIRATPSATGAAALDALWAGVQGVNTGQGVQRKSIGLSIGANTSVYISPFADALHVGPILILFTASYTQNFTSWRWLPDVANTTYITVIGAGNNGGAASISVASGAGVNQVPRRFGFGFLLVNRTNGAQALNCEVQTGTNATTGNITTWLMHAQS